MKKVTFPSNFTIKMRKFYPFIQPKKLNKIFIRKNKFSKRKDANEGEIY